MLRNFLLFSLAVSGVIAWVPKVAAVPALPNINTNNIVNITNFGAISSTTLTNTAAIQAAIDSAATTNGGCTVEIPEGTYLSGPLTLRSRVNLMVDTNAILKMLPMSAWPNASTPFLYGSSISDVEICGSGTIDGNSGFGASDWWGPVNGSPAGTRPNFIQFSSSSRILIQGVTLQNPPTFHIMIKNSNANITVQGITINTPGNSPNTDGFDIGSTNVLIQNSTINTGDDNVEIGGSSGTASYIVVTNCQFGTGHGVSIGGYCQAGISNVTVIDCGFTGTDNGIRMKSDFDRGGLVQNLAYYNIGITNVRFPIIIYSYYTWKGTPDTVTPQVAASTNAATITTTPPIWRNITISNLTVISGTNCIIWARTELPATNIVFKQAHIFTPKSFEVYNARGIQFVDSMISNTVAGVSTFALYNAQLVVTNSAFSNNLVTLDGLTTNGYGNSLAFYNARASLKNTNAFDDG
ncbi:MAG TPA: glycosyl hydrolase family 28 protein, partial [Candidatus Acidoferrum sp.]|nr:glycosyl hydrolase family 28 protein [Candidatus Acidoferrum sp.]